MVGSVLSGVINGRLGTALADAGPARLVEFEIPEAAALEAGLSCGGAARFLVGSAAELPADLWQRLVDREPVCLVTPVHGDTVDATQLFTRATVAEAGPEVAHLFGRGMSQTGVVDDRVVTSLWPVPELVIIGGGVIADALVAVAGVVDWVPRIVTDATTATEAITGLGEADGVVVLSHDREVDGPALTAALGGRVGYVGALGSRRTQQARAEWLTAHGVVEQSAIHGPAGLDVGADTPGEIAIAIVAEMLSARSGGTAGSLRDTGAPIHRNRAGTPWPHSR
ncbi:MAG: XdhC family protein [Jatrophihabitans sp.]